MPASISIRIGPTSRPIWSDICVKMMEKLPQNRYARSQDVAGALRAWLDGKPFTPGLSESGGLGVPLPPLPGVGPKLPQIGGGAPVRAVAAKRLPPIRWMI